MSFSDWIGSLLLALLLALVLGVLGRHRRTRGEARADVVVMLAAGILISLAVILILVLAVTR